MSQTNHLIRRNGTWYYRRRVPLALVEHIGSKFIQFSLHTTDLNEAKKRRAVEDIKTAHRFEAAGAKSSSTKFAKAPLGTKQEPLSQAELKRLVCDYVDRCEEGQARARSNPAVTHPIAVVVITVIGRFWLSNQCGRSALCSGGGF